MDVPHCCLLCRLEELPFSGEDFRERVASFSAVCSSCLVNVKYSSLRVKTLEAVNSLTAALKGTACMQLVLTDVLCLNASLLFVGY